MTEHPSGLVLSLQRVLDAPRERVFGLLTEPRELAKWWGPRGFSMPELELNLSVEGRYRFTMQPPEGEAFHLSGVFLEIDPPTRLVYTFVWEEPDPDDRETVVRLSLKEAGAATEVSVWQGEFETEERLLLHHDGWTDSLERLAEVIATPTS